MTEGFTIGNGIALAGLLLTGSAMLAGVWYRIELRIRGVEDKANDKITAAEKALTDYKLHVTEKYASWNSVEQIEGRLAQRIDAITEGLVKMPDLIMDRLAKYMTLANSSK